MVSFDNKSFSIGPRLLISFYLNVNENVVKSGLFWNFFSDFVLNTLLSF